MFLFIATLLSNHERIMLSIFKVLLDESTEFVGSKTSSQDR
jgi:hypothetical protein